MEAQTTIQKALMAVQPDIFGHRWDEETLFLITEAEEMESGEFSQASLTRHIMDGIEEYLSFHNTEAYSYHRGTQ